MTDETRAPREKPKEIGKDHQDVLRYLAMRKPKFRDWRDRGVSLVKQLHAKAMRLAENG